MFVIILAAGIAFISVGFFFHRRQKNLEGSCTSQTEGTVIRLDRQERTYTETDDDGNTRERKGVTYHPVFSYGVGGRKIEKTATAGSGRPEFTEGQKVTVMYDPQNFGKYYVKEDKTGSRFGIYFMIFGAIVFIFGIVAMFLPSGSLIVN